MTSVSKNVYIDKLEDIVNKYNNTYHNVIKMNPVDVNPSTYFDFSKKIIRKILNLKLVIVLEYQNITIFLQKVQNWFKEVFVIKKVKSTVPWTYVINDLNCVETVRTFYEKELQKANQIKV